MALRVLAAASINFGSPLGLRQLRRGSTTPELARARMLLSFPACTAKESKGSTDQVDQEKQAIKKKKQGGKEDKRVRSAGRGYSLLVCEALH